MKITHFSWILVALLASSLVFSSCEKPDDSGNPNADVENLITVEMYDEDNGKTVIEDMLLYINKDKCFEIAYSMTSGVYEVGRKKLSSFEKEDVWDIKWDRSAPINPKHSYIVKCEAGPYIIRNYFKLYVNDYIYNMKGEVVGATVQYCYWYQW